MAIGSPRWGGIRTDPYNPDSPDADNDGIVQEGTLFERPAGTRIVSALTGLELEAGSPGSSIQDTRGTIIVDRQGRPVPYKQSWSGGTLSAREQNGTVGDTMGTIGSSLGNLDGPPPAPKPDPVLLRPTDVDKNGKPLRVFVADDRRFHGVQPKDWAGFDFPGWNEAEAHWAESGLILPNIETPISPTDPRLPERLYIPSRNPMAHRDLGVARADEASKKVKAYTSRVDALEAAKDATKEAEEKARQDRLNEFFERNGYTQESWLERGFTLEDAEDEDRQYRINNYIAQNGYTFDAWLEAGDLFGGHKVGDSPAEAPAVVTYPQGFGSIVMSAFRDRNPGLAAFLDREGEDLDDEQEVLFDLGNIPVETPLGQLREEFSSFESWVNQSFSPIRKEPVTEDQLRDVNASLQSAFGQVVAPDFKPYTVRDPKTGRFVVEPRQEELPFGDVVEVPIDNIATGAAVTFTPHTTRDPKTGRFIKASEVNVYGDVRIDTEAAPEPVRREVEIATPVSLGPIKDRFDEAGFELYLVGGAVRDTLAGRDVKDYDLATDANPDQVQALLADVPDAEIDLTGADFAVVRVWVPDPNGKDGREEYEIATFRRDVGEGRRPDEVEFTTIDEDVRRRDLTMNALFYDLSTGEIVDYVGGIEDIENGVVRAVGDPAERFREDPLRILRAFRFSGRYGWGMDSATVDAIRSNSKLRGVAAERTRTEFRTGIEKASSPSGYLQQIDLVDDGTGIIWSQIFPDLNVSTANLPADGTYRDEPEGRKTVMMLASLLADNDPKDVEKVLTDRKFTKQEITDATLLMEARNINDGNVFDLKNKFGKNDRVSADDMRVFHRSQPNTEDEIEPFLEFADNAPAVTAADLQEQGIKPGPQFGAMIREGEEQAYRQIRDGFSVDNPGHGEGEAPPLPDRPSKLFVGPATEKNVPQSPTEVIDHMRSAGFRMTGYGEGKSIGALDFDDPYEFMIFFTVEEAPDGGSAIRRLDMREVADSDLVQDAVQRRTRVWREGITSRGRAWHAVRNYDTNFGRAVQGLRDDEPNPAEPVAETIDSIRRDGLQPKTRSRVESNSGFGDAIFLSEAQDEIDHFASPHIDDNGDEQPTALLEIDLKKALDDGVIDPKDLEPEPDLFEAAALANLLEELGAPTTALENSYDLPGVTAQTIVLRKPIPNEYISINGRSIRDVGMRDLKPNDYGSPAAAPETPSADLLDSDAPEGRNWERPPMPSPSGFDQLLYTDTQSGHKAHVYSSYDEEVDSVLDRIYDTAVERGWGMKIANTYFWDDVHGPDANPINRGQRGKGVTVYFPSSERWEEDARELHRLMEGYKPSVGDGNIPEDVMIGNGVGMRYEYWEVPDGDIDMTNRPGQDLYSNLYRAASAPHTEETLAVHNRYRELFPEPESLIGDDDEDLAEWLSQGIQRLEERRRLAGRSGVNRDVISFYDSDELIDAFAVNFPELASNPSEVQRRLAPKKGDEQVKLAYVNSDTLKIHQAETQDIIGKLEALEQSRDLDEYELETLEKARAHNDRLTSDIESGGGYYPLEITTFDNDGEIATPDSVKKALESEKTKQVINDILSQLAPEYRSSRIAVSPVDSNGATIPDNYGFYYPEEDRIYLSPNFFEHIFAEAGVSFDDYQEWATSRKPWKLSNARTAYINKMSIADLKNYIRNTTINPGARKYLPEGYDLDASARGKEEFEKMRTTLAKAVTDYETIEQHKFFWNPKYRDDFRAEGLQKARATLRSLMLHENFHGVHFRRDGRWNSPEFVKVREKVAKAIRKSGLFKEIIEDDELTFAEDDNYFQYLMTWLADGKPASQAFTALLDDLDWKDLKKGSKEHKDAIGAEMFAEVMTHAALGRKFPGSDIILDYLTGESVDRPDTPDAPTRLAGRPVQTQDSSPINLPNSIGRETFGDFEPRSMFEIQEGLLRQLRFEDKAEAERVENMSPSEWNSELTRVSQRLAETLEDGNLAMNMPGSILRDLAAGDGRFKNQHETGNTRGLYDPTLRERAEGAQGVPLDASSELRPKYGYVEGTIWDDRSVGAYGDVRIRLKDEVADRTTISFGDSLADGLPGVRLNDLRDGSADPERVATAVSRDSFTDTWTGSDFVSNYAELQFHDRLGLADVDEVILSNRSDSFTPEEAAAFVKALQDYGITVKYQSDYDSDEQVVNTGEDLYNYLPPWEGL